ncbi:MAG: Gfo/Idh/MocA family oxidoreductase [Planctomycetales bacterium]|nr:Gfo/Idh/MocA family oxidoreductase [Planctomycetales bacterium]
MQNRKAAVRLAAICWAVTMQAFVSFGTQGEEKSPVLRVGVIGLDTSHAIAFTDLLNKENPADDVAGCRVVAAYPKGSADIESSVSRQPKYIQQMRDRGVKIVDSVDELLPLVDCVLLETNDGRPHLKQLNACLKAGKRTFIDKPLAADLADVVAIFEVSKRHGVPVFSSSALRFGRESQAARNGSLGEITSCETSSPASVEKTHTELYWYGIHGVESLFTVLGTGCQSVSQTTEDGAIVASGKWSGDRTGVFREGKGYSGHAKGSKGEGPVGSYDGYAPLVTSIVHYFRTGETPVAPEETIELYAFMSAAAESKAQDGKAVPLADVLTAARKEAQSRLKSLESE